MPASARTETPSHRPCSNALCGELAVFRRVRDEIRAVFGAYAAGRLDQAKLAR